VHDAVRTRTHMTDQATESCYLDVIQSGSKAAEIIWTAISDCSPDEACRNSAILIMRDRIDLASKTVQAFMTEQRATINARIQAEADRRAQTQEKARPSFNWDEFFRDAESTSRAPRPSSPPPPPRSPVPAPAPRPPVDAMERWLAPLLEKISRIADKPSAKRPVMKSPDNFTGKDLSKFRAWWRTVQDYVSVNEPTMPQDKIKIMWLGSLLRDEAQRWLVLATVPTRRFGSGSGSKPDRFQIGGPGCQ
jgi:hypothetical protein